MPYRRDTRSKGAGDYRHLLVFERKTETKVYGTTTESWAPEFEDFGAFYPLGSREFPVSQKRQAESSAKFEIRYREGIDPDFHRIVFQGKTWNIYPPLDDGRRICLEIEASEIV